MTAPFLAGVEIPEMTAAQRDSLAAEQREKATVIFNTDRGRVEINVGTSGAPVWRSVDDVGVIGVQVSAYSGLYDPTAIQRNSVRWSVEDYDPFGFANVGGGAGVDHKLVVPAGMSGYYCVWAQVNGIASPGNAWRIFARKRSAADAILDRMGGDHVNFDDVGTAMSHFNTAPWFFNAGEFAELHFNANAGDFGNVQRFGMYLVASALAT